MNSFTQRDVDTLFANICCSQCKNNFTINSIKILEKFEQISIINLSCEKCGKDFGNVLIKTSKNKHLPFEIIEGPNPISYDDVIDAHKFIKENL